MNKLYQKKRQEGFTIIEVMIVLAIAGVILLIVFLAIPALQRNNRNTQRSSDAARVAAAINECMTNNNGNINQCNTAALLANYVTMANNQQLINFTVGAPVANNVDTVYFAQASRCNGNAPAGGAGVGARSFSLAYNVESSSGNAAPRCIGS